MEELDRKRVKVVYFRSDGEMYRVEEEYVIGVFSQQGIIKEVLKKIRYNGLDFVILDGDDGVRPYFRPYLSKGTKLLRGSRGFGRRGE